jgi:hypothetical protein
MSPRDRLVRLLLTLVGACVWAAPWAVTHGEPPQSSAGSAYDCDPAQPGSIASGVYYFNVTGRVVFAAQGGALIPVRGAKFFVTETSPRGLDTVPRKLSVKFAKSGAFRFQAFVSTATRSKPCTDGQVQTHDLYLTTLLLLRATGCEDLILRVEKDWNPGTIVMQCPGRS